VLLIMARAGFKGEPNGCFAKNECHCEHVYHGAAIAQPVNTWSNLAYTATGFLILFAAFRDGDHDENGEGMHGVNAYTTVFGILVIAIGSGSMFFHASMTNWGGAMDVVAMNLFLSFIIFFTTRRLFRWPGFVFWSIWTVANTVFITLRLVRPAAGLGIFNILFVVMLVLEISVILARRLANRGKKHVHELSVPGIPFRDWKPLATALVCFGTGYAFWVLWQNDSPLCDPYSPFQGHAVWHFLTAGSTWFMFRYLRSDEGRLPANFSIEQPGT